MTGKFKKTLFCAFSTCLLFTTSGCGENKEAGVLYDILLEIAQKEYAEAKGNDGSEEIKGISSVLLQETLTFCAYTEESIIYTCVDYNFNFDYGLISNFIEDYNNQKKIETSAKFGKIVDDGIIRNKYYDKVMLSNNPGADPQYAGIEPSKYISYILDEDPNYIAISITCKTGSGDYVCAQDVTFSVKDKSEGCYGSSDIFRKKENPIFYSLCKDYILR